MLPISEAIQTYQQPLALVNKPCKQGRSIKEVTPDLNQETLLLLFFAQRMWINVVVVALTLSQLGNAQECEGFVGVLGMTPDQLKKEIETTVAAALKQGAVTNSFCSANETYIVLPRDELNSTLEKVVDIVSWKNILLVLWKKSLQTYQTHLNS